MQFRARRALLVDLWALVLTLAFTWPLWRSGGYPLARDLVFTPEIPLRPETLGLGTAAPRAVPLDAVAAILGFAVDGAVLGRVAIAGALVLAGMGMHRLIPRADWIARATVAGFAIWNPYVAERLALGQWALLLAYAALPWLALGLNRGGAAAIVAPLALASLTPTGGLLALATVIAMALRAAHEGRARLRVVGLAIVAQLPWIVPSLLSSAAATSDAAGLSAFAARSEFGGSAYLSLWGFGGIWDAQSVPASRSGWLGVLSALVGLVGVLWFAKRGARMSLVGVRQGPALVVLALGSWLVAGLGSLSVLQPLLVRLIDTVPGFGLLRDGQKWLAPLVLVGVLGWGLFIDSVLAYVRTRAAAWVPLMAALAIVGPLALLPDATGVVHRTLVPVRYPAEVAAISAAVRDSDGAVAVGPWRLYRRLGWAGPAGVYDPASRLLDARVVTDDRLLVGGTSIAGEDPYAAAVGQALAAPSPHRPADLSRLGVRWVLVHRDGNDAELLRNELVAEGGRVVVGGRWLELIEVSSHPAAAPAPSTAEVAAIAGLDLAVALLLVGTWLAGRFPRRRSADIPDR